MKYQNFFLPIVCFFLFLSLLQSCKPCCDDPLIVKLPNSDATPPTLRWEVAVMSLTPTGPVSSMTMYSDPVTNIAVKTTDKVDIYLIAADNESGVKKISMKGGFGYTCIPAGGGTALAVDGFIPEQSMDFSPLTTCGIKEWKLSIAPLNVALSCPNSGLLSGGSIGIIGSGENFKGGVSSLTLNVSVSN